MINPVTAETGIIASCLLDGSAAIDRLEGLRPEHFFAEPWRQTFAAILDLEAEGKATDPVTVCARLEATDRLKQVGGRIALAEIVDSAPSAFSALPELARLVMEAHALRSLRGVGASLAAAAANEQTGDPRPLLERSRAELDRIEQSLDGGGDENDAVAALDGYLALAKDMASGTAPPAVSTGIRDLDDSLGGFRRGFVCVLGGPTNWGKSGYALMVVDLGLQAAKRSLIVSFEDAPELYLRRLAVRRARVSAYAARQNLLRDDDWSKLQNAMGEISQEQREPLVLKSIGKPIEWACRRIGRLCQQHEYDLIVFDYLQAARSEGRFRDTRERVNEVLRQMCDVVKANGVAGIIVSQFSRLPPGQEPTLNSLKESGDIENGAETVLLGFCGKDEIHTLRLAKAKDAVVGEDFSLEWDSKSACFDPGARKDRR